MKQTQTYVSLVGSNIIRDVDVVPPPYIESAWRFVLGCFHSLGGSRASHLGLLHVSSIYLWLQLGVRLRPLFLLCRLPRGFSTLSSSRDCLRLLEFLHPWA